MADDDIRATVLVLTHAIDCPWCIAKAGEPCYIQQSGLGYAGVDHSGLRVYTARAVPRDEHERWLRQQS